MEEKCKRETRENWKQVGQALVARERGETEECWKRGRGWKTGHLEGLWQVVEVEGRETELKNSRQEKEEAGAGI